MLRMLRNLQKMRRNEIRRRRGAQTSNRPVPKSLRRHQNCQSFRTKQKVNLKLQKKRKLKIEFLFLEKLERPCFLHYPSQYTSLNYSSFY